MLMIAAIRKVGWDKRSEVPPRDARKRKAVGLRCACPTLHRRVAGDRVSFAPKGHSSLSPGQRPGDWGRHVTGPAQRANRSTGYGKKNGWPVGPKIAETTSTLLRALPWAERTKGLRPSHASHHGGRRGLATLELALSLPVLLMVMALMVNFGNVASWKVRALGVARSTVGQPAASIDRQFSASDVLASKCESGRQQPTAADAASRSGRRIGWAPRDHAWPCGICYSEHR